jgi:hypothetical protein
MDCVMFLKADGCVMIAPWYQSSEIAVSILYAGPLGCSVRFHTYGGMSRKWIPGKRDIGALTA